MTIKALIFDFDGLLMDTETTLLESWRSEWRRHGLRLDPTGFFADHGGDANEQRFAALAAAVGPAYDRESSHARRTAHRLELNKALAPAPGIVGWLERAAELGLRLAVASSARERLCIKTRRLRALCALFPSLNPCSGARGARSG